MAKPKRPDLLSPNADGRDLGANHDGLNDTDVIDEGALGNLSSPTTEAGTPDGKTSADHSSNPLNPNTCPGSD